MNETIWSFRIIKEYSSADYPDLNESSAKELFINDIANSNFKIETTIFDEAMPWKTK